MNRISHISEVFHHILIWCTLHSSFMDSLEGNPILPTTTSVLWKLRIKFQYSF